MEDDDPIEHASQAHILKVMELMGCDEGYGSAVRRLPQIDVCREVQCASVPSEVDIAAMNRVENVFRRGVKAWALLLLPNLRIKGDLKMAFSIQSITTTIEEPEDCENQAASCVPSSSISPEVLNSIPNTSRICYGMKNATQAFLQGSFWYLLLTFLMHTLPLCSTSATNMQDVWLSKPSWSISSRV